MRAMVVNDVHEVRGRQNVAACQTCPQKCSSRKWNSNRKYL
jgi:hypothetical protein